MPEIDFLQRILKQGDKTAIIWHDHEISYKTLYEKIGGFQLFLEKEGVQPGECIAFVGDFSPQTIAFFLALIQNKNIVVPLSVVTRPDHPEYLEIAYANMVVEFDEFDHYRARRLLPKGTHPLLEELRINNQPGLIIFSSGSTGKAKASLHNFERLIAKIEEGRQAYRTLTFLLMDHIGGINTLMRILSNGGTLVILHARTVDCVCELIQKYQIELLPTTPTFLNMLLISKVSIRYDLSSLRLITYGTEPMPQTTLKAVCEALPNVRLKQTYGSTELGILSTLSENNNSFWMKISQKKDELKIIDHILWIRTLSSMLGYLNAPSPFDKEGWMNTGDIVEVKGEYLHILGRKSEIINVGGQKVFPGEVENIILKAPNVKDVVVSGRPNPLIGHLVVATVELYEAEDPKILSSRLRLFCRQTLEPYKIPAIVTIAKGNLHGARFKKMRASVDLAETGES